MKIKRFLILILAIVLLVPSSGIADDSKDSTDLLLFVAHPGDELLYFSGLLDWYAGELGYDCQVVYLSSKSDEVSGAAAEVIHSLGVKREPVFAGFSPEYADTESSARDLWKSKDVLEYCTAQIRKFRPSVVVTHDAEGEYGHGVHILTASIVQQAVKYAADESRCRSSVKEYGTWQVSRCFLHLGTNDSVTIDQSTSLICTGKTITEKDNELYKLYPEGYRDDKLTVTGELYSRAQYGLCFGDAPSGNDLFSGLPCYVEGGPNPAVPSPEPKPEITPEPSAVPEPTQEPAPATAAPSPEQKAVVKSSSLSVWIPFAVLAGGMLLFYALIKLQAKPLGYIILTIALVLSAFLFYKALKKTEPLSNPVSVNITSVPEPVPADTPEPEMKPEETLEPEPETTSEPEEPDDTDLYFASPGESDSYSADTDNGHWEYRSENLSVIIDRYQHGLDTKNPVTYFVAHIRMRNEDAFRTGFSLTNKLEMPWKVARRYKAVIGITGDNLSRTDTQLKGVIIRDGKIYHKGNHAMETLAFMPDLSLKIFERSTVTADEMLEMGITNTTSFGPVLIQDGLVNHKPYREEIMLKNPRVGIGMIEPGHLVAVEVDGRQKGYSTGITLEEFSHLFYSLGCTDAYNLDGGASSCMVFMGEHVNQHGASGSDYQRPLADMLIWGESDLVPSVDDPIYNKGNKKK